MPGATFSERTAGLIAALAPSPGGCYNGRVVAAHCSWIRPAQPAPPELRAGICNCLKSALRPGSSVVERGPEKAGVGGSIPSLATTPRNVPRNPDSDERIVILAPARHAVKNCARTWPLGPPAAVFPGYNQLRAGDG